MSVVRLEIGGMTCASCAARVEKKLNRMPGVAASVNYATESARVELPEGTSIADAIAVVEATGYSAALPQESAADSDQRDRARTKLLVSAVLAVPVVALSMVPALQFPGWQWVALALATPVATWGAWDFHRAAFVNARHGIATMDTLVSVGVLSAYAWSVWALFFGGAGAIGMKMSFSLLPMRGDMAVPELYLEVAAGVTVLLLLGRYWEARAKYRAGDSLRSLGRMSAKSATVLTEGGEISVPIDEVRVGDVMLVRAGEKIPTDAIVIQGTSAVDVSMLTGESVPVDVGPGDDVIGASINTSGSLTIQATRVGADTAMATIARLVTDAQSGKAQVQRLADRVSSVFVPVVFGLALVSLVFWLFTGDVEYAFSAAVSVLIIACPCALGLATPTALLVGTGRAAALGIIIRGPQVLESTRKVDTIVLDKTGTVTTGDMTVQRVISVAGDRDVVVRGASVDRGSTHPVAQALVAFASEQGLTLPIAESFVSSSGFGATAVVEGVAVAVGRPQWLVDEWAMSMPDVLAAEVEAVTGASMVAVGWDGQVRGIVLVSDSVKPTSARAIAEFMNLGLEPILLTGDHHSAADSVAWTVGISTVISGVKPDGKVQAIQELQAHGHVVAFVGDGVNDAAALAVADLGIVMGTGADAAIEAGDITLMRADLLAAVDSIRLSRRTLRTIRGNLTWAFAYNVAAIPLAMAGLLTPLVAGAAMAFSSVFVVTNSLRLRRFAWQR